MRHRFFIRLFTTSLVNITIIIVGLFWFLQFSFMGTVRADVQARDREVLLQIQKRIDENLIAMRRIALSISLDSIFSPFYLPDDPLKAMDGIKNLRNYSLISTDLVLLGIAYRDSEFVLTDKGSVSKSNFHLFDIPDYDDLTDPDILRRGFINHKSNLIFLFSYPMQTPSAPRGVIFSLISKSSFAVGLLESVSGHERYLTISSAAHGDILFTNQPASVSDLSVTEYVSDLTGFRYMIATPNTFFDSVLNSLRFKSALVLAGLFFLGIFLNYAIARYNAQPLRRLIGKLTQGHDDEAFETVETIIAERQSVGERAARDIFLLDLMQGALATTEETRRKAREVDLDFAGEFFAFIVVHGDENMLPSAGSSCDQVEIEGERFFRQRIHSGGNDVWAYNGTAEALDDATLVRFRTEAYTEGSSATIGVGSVSAEPRSAARSFLEASTAVNYRLVRGSGGIIRFDSLPRADSIDWDALDERLGVLRNALQNLDSSGAESTVAAILNQCTGISLPSARHILWRLLQSFEEQNLIRHGVPVRQMAGIGSVAELLDFVRTQTGGALARMTGAKKGSDNEIVTELKTHIEVHFDDRMLSLDSLADSLGYSVGYLCKIFKQETNTTVAAYIQELRLREACRLLRATDLPVKDIVQKIGYMDHASFSRSFKSRTGFSPQTYRSQR